MGEITHTSLSVSEATFKELLWTIKAHYCPIYLEFTLYQGTSTKSTDFPLCCGLPSFPPIPSWWTSGSSQTTWTEGQIQCDTCGSGSWIAVNLHNRAVWLHSPRFVSFASPELIQQMAYLGLPTYKYSWNHHCHLIKCHHLHHSLSKTDKYQHWDLMWLCYHCILTESLTRWAAEDSCGIWLRVTLQQSALIAVAAKYGFRYHHAENEHAVLCKWIEDSPCRLPRFATHQVGVAGKHWNWWTSVWHK